jgi:histidinol-phosphate aminotransferase
VSGPTPRPGILDIAHYVPGKAKIEGVEKPIKLSANENALGCSPLGREAYLAAAQDIASTPRAGPTRFASRSPRPSISNPRG